MTTGITGSSSSNSCTIEVAGEVKSFCSECRKGSLKPGCIKSIEVPAKAARGGGMGRGWGVGREGELRVVGVD